MSAIGAYTKLAQRKKKAMARLILGFQGLLPPVEYKRWLQNEDAAGFILFARNVEELEQVWECNQQLKGISKNPILSVDQEGGRVRRIKNTNWPPMRFLGNLDHLPTTDAVIKGINQELLELGFNANWAPCADVDSNPDNPVIGDRSFGRTPELCARHVRQSIESMHQLNMIACAKHFPGHGDTDLDSHLELPTVHKQLAEIEACELIPFQAAISAGVQIIMTAHVLFPELDEEKPATMSKNILSGILREKMGYSGLIVSDDMEMKAVRGRYPLDFQLDQSIRAGVDLFLFCSEMDLQHEAFEILVQLQEKYPEHERLADDSFARLEKLRKGMLSKTKDSPPNFSMIGSEQYQQLASEIRKTGEGLA